MNLQTFGFIGLGLNLNCLKYGAIDFITPSINLKAFSSIFKRVFGNSIVFNEEQFAKA